MTALGQKRTSHQIHVMSALRLEADSPPHGIDSAQPFSGAKTLHGASQAAHWECGQCRTKMLISIGSCRSAAPTLRAGRLSATASSRAQAIRLEVLGAWLDAILAGASEY